MSDITIRQLPAAEPRVETGPIQFAGDWPGMFFRGDDGELSLLLRASKRMILRREPIGARDRELLAGAIDKFLAKLRACQLQPGDPRTPEKGR